MHKFFRFFNTKECFYHDHVKTLSSSEVQNHKRTHGDIGNKIIKIFKMLGLLSEMLNDLFEIWDKGEPLTRRINRSLKYYKEELHIFKEFIQNVDDADVTEISFLW